MLYAITQIETIDEENNILFKPLKNIFLTVNQVINSTSNY
jgi:hypothetical protein